MSPISQVGEVQLPRDTKMNEMQPTFSPNAAANQPPPTAPVQEAPSQPAVSAAPTSGGDDSSRMEEQLKAKGPDAKQLALSIDDSGKEKPNLTKEANKAADKRNKPATEYKPGNDTAWQGVGAGGGVLMTAGGITCVAVGWTGVGLIVGLVLMGVGAIMSGLAAGFGGKGAKAQATMQQGEAGRKEMADKTAEAGEARKISILEDSMTQGPQGGTPSPTARMTMESSAKPA